MLTECNPTPYWFPCPKNPNDVADYKFDWALFIDTDPIVSTTISVNGVVLVVSQIVDAGMAVVMRLSGGVAGSTAGITNTIVTQSGQTFVKTAKLIIK